MKNDCGTNKLLAIDIPTKFHWQHCVGFSFHRIRNNNFWGNNDRIFYTCLLVGTYTVPNNVNYPVCNTFITRNGNNKMLTIAQRIIINWIQKKLLVKQKSLRIKYRWMQSLNRDHLPATLIFSSALITYECSR